MLQSNTKSLILCRNVFTNIQAVYWVPFLAVKHLIIKKTLFYVLRDPSAITQNSAIVFLFLLKHIVRSVTFSKSILSNIFIVTYTPSLLETLNANVWCQETVGEFIFTDKGLISKRYWKNGEVSRHSVYILLLLTLRYLHGLRLIVLV
jgi:hypothetical protein